MTNYELLIDINQKSKENIERLDQEGKMVILNKYIAFSNDFNTWLSYCGPFSEYRLIKEAQTECVNSIYLCAQGFYKEAISALRQCLEHTLFSVMLSTSDYNYRLWQAGKYDMSWTKLMDDQNGIFGVEFIRAYANDVDEARSMELRTIAIKVYRECSEFVHGNYEKISILSEKLIYSEKMFDQYASYFESIKYVISMALFIRFREIFNIPDNLRGLEAIIMDNLGMISEVQLLYSIEGGPEDE